MSGGGGSQGTSTTTEKADPWSGIQPFLTDLYGRGQTQSNIPQQYYPDSTVTGFAPETEAGLGFMTERALNGSPLLGAAQNESMKTLGGDYLAQGNPYLSGVADNLWAQVRPRVDSAFSRGGLGSPGEQYAMTDAFTNALAPYGFNSYEAERGRMMGAMSGAPGLANADYTDAQQLLGVGAQREDLQGRIIQDSLNRYNFGQAEPRNSLNWYAGLLQNPGGGTSTSTTTGQQPGGNTALGLLGAGLSAAPYLAMAFSDRRIKTDIKKVGMLDNDLPVYAYRYKAGGPMHIGLMAQDVEKVNPDAVAEIDGIKAVNYRDAVR